MISIRRSVPKRKVHNHKFTFYRSNKFCEDPSSKNEYWTAAFFHLTPCKKRGVEKISASHKFYSRFWRRKSQRQKVALDLGKISPFNLLLESL